MGFGPLFAHYRRGHRKARSPSRRPSLERGILAYPFRGHSILHLGCNITNTTPGIAGLGAADEEKASRDLRRWRGGAQRCS